MFQVYAETKARTNSLAAAKCRSIRSGFELKKLISLFVVLSMLLTLIPATIFAQEGSVFGVERLTANTLPDAIGNNIIVPWDGTSADTAWYVGHESETGYGIGTAAELAGLAYLVNAGGVTFTDKTITLTSDIDLGNQLWEPIGQKAHPFNGLIDGGYYTVKGLYVDKSAETSNVCAGLVGYMSGESNDADGIYPGVTKLIVTGTVIGNSTDGAYGSETGTGGVVGAILNRVTATLSYIGFEGAVTGVGNAGGILGIYRVGNDIYGCYNRGTITATAANGYAGGIAGSHASGAVYITSCYNTGSLTGWTVAGIIPETGTMHPTYRGNYNAGTLTGTYTYGTVSGTNNTSDSYYLAGCGATDTISTAVTAAELTPELMAAKNTYGRVTWVNPPSGANGNFPVFSWESFPVYYMVTFDTTGGSAVEAQTVEADTAATVPETPEKVGYEFTGWYTDEELTIPYDFSIPITQNITLYAAWNKTIVPWDGISVDTAWYVGHESETEYGIGTAVELAGLAYLVKSSAVIFTGKKITLLSDIDLNNKNWTSIGTSSNKFSGTFDGGGYTVSNVTVNGTATYQGFFGNIENGVVKKLNLKGVRIVSTKNYTGGLAGQATNSTIENCTVIGTVSGAMYTGGLIGQINGSTIKAGDSNATVAGTSSVGAFAGGIVVSTADAVVVDCTAAGTVTASSRYAGGFTGNTYVSSGTYTISVIGCESSASVTGAQVNFGTYGWFCGGFVGEVGGPSADKKVMFTDCTASGAVDASIASQVTIPTVPLVGGFVGNVQNAYVGFINCTADSVITRYTGDNAPPLGTYGGFGGGSANAENPSPYATYQNCLYNASGNPGMMGVAGMTDNSAGVLPEITFAVTEENGSVPGAICIDVGSFGFENASIALVIGEADFTTKAVVANGFIEFYASAYGEYKAKVINSTVASMISNNAGTVINYRYTGFTQPANGDPGPYKGNGTAENPYTVLASSENYSLSWKSINFITGWYGSYGYSGSCYGDTRNPAYAAAVLIEYRDPQTGVLISSTFIEPNEWTPIYEAIKGPHQIGIAVDAGENSTLNVSAAGYPRAYQGPFDYRVYVGDIAGVLPGNVYAVDSTTSRDVFTANANSASYMGNPSVELMGQLIDASVASTEASEAFVDADGYLNIKLYNNGSFTLTLPSTTVYYTADFNTTGGSDIEAQTVEEGGTVTMPEAPERANYDFVGWYADEALTIPYYFATPVTQDMTLYAAWKQAVKTTVSVAQAGSATVSLNADFVNGWIVSVTGSENYVTHAIVENGSITFAAPAAGSYTVKQTDKTVENATLTGSSTGADAVEAAAYKGTGTAEDPFVVLVDLTAVDAGFGISWKALSGWAGYAVTGTVTGELNPAIQKNIVFEARDKVTGELISSLQIDGTSGERQPITDALKAPYDLHYYVDPDQAALQNWLDSNTLYNNDYASRQTGLYESISKLKAGGKKTTLMFKTAREFFGPMALKLDAGKLGYKAGDKLKVAYLGGTGGGVYQGSGISMTEKLESEFAYSEYYTDKTYLVDSNGYVEIDFYNGGLFVIFTPSAGDVSGDGIIDVSDVIMAAEIAVGNTSYTQEQITRANVSSKTNTIVDIADVVLIAERAVGGLVPFPIELTQ